jgi:hypothetical protein
MSLPHAITWIIGSPSAPPLDPNSAEARQQLAHELAKAGYQSAKPTLIQLIEKALSDWFASIRPFGVAGVGDSLGLVIVILLIAALAVGFLIFGVPRLNRRARSVGSLFGDEDERDSVTLRRAAEAAAAAGDYATAIAEEFRAIARGLSERTVVVTFPGTTAHGFAERAALSFPASSAALRAAADSFDGVRYLSASGSEAEWLAVSALERALRAAKPILEGALA